MPSPAVPARHVLVPFDLRNPATNIDDDDVRQVLYSIFPGTLNVNLGQNDAYLFFQLDTLPQGPWPLTVGGLPITISTFTHGKGPLFPKATLSPSRRPICQDLAGADLADPAVLLELATRVNDEFQKAEPPVRLVELIYTTDQSLYAVLDVVDLYAVLPSLPSIFAKTFVRYVRDVDIQRPDPANPPAEPGIVPQPTQGIEDESDERVGGRCYLNGIDGVVITKSVKLERSTHPTEDAMRCVVYHWAYLGQEQDATDKARPPDGIRGSAISNDDGVVLGYYQYYLQNGPFAGFAVMVDAKEVVKAGYRLEKIVKEPLSKKKMC